MSWTLPPELDVGQFRVRRLLGEGGMGRVYLARDQVLGRLVALKIVRADRLGADGAERFLEEARLTARFAHPHIVTIFEVGRFRGVPFLALEYLDGESLHTRLRREQPSTDEALRIVRAVADAVAHAHARGVRHGDLKPGNVMLPSDGRLRVVDFGLAVELRQDAAARRAGTLTYMAPEYWQGGAVSDRADVWALATLLAECLLGRPPSPRLPAQWARTSDTGRARTTDARVWAPADPAGAWTTRAELAACERLSPALREVLGRALDDAPEARPTAAELYQALDHELGRTRVAAGVQDSPFRGLLPFEARHAQAFFGREVELEAFLTRLRGEPALYVVGPSGVGKSSFVHAGVLARLAAREPWVVVTVRPGVTPVRTLAASLVRAGQQGPESVEVELDAVEAVAARLRAHPATLAVELAELGRRRGGRVVLVVDQLEELFTHGASAVDREVYLAAVSSAAEDALEPTRVIVTVRDDFVGRVPGVRAIFALNPLSRAALASTVLEPLRQVGYEPDDAALVSRMVDALDEAPGQLPLLQFVCRLLWESRDAGRRVVLSRVYEQMGGVAGALSVRWVPAPNLHLTLKFLGPVRAAAVEAVAARLAAGLGGVRPFELEARGVGAFPSVERPRVLWVGVSAQPALVALQQAVEGWMAEIGFPRDERAYHPHITIGRVTGQGSHDGGGGGDRPGDLGALLSERGARAFGTGRATEVVIYESRTLSKGAEYHALGRVPLSA